MLAWVANPITHPARSPAAAVVATYSGGSARRTKSPMTSLTIEAARRSRMTTERAATS